MKNKTAIEKELDIKVEEEKKKKGGRPKIKLGADQVQLLASFGCTNTEIASFFNCDRTTITKRFSRNIAKGKDEGKIRLRQKQYSVAMSGNVAMLIWLGKQVLKQSDKQDIDLTDMRQYQVSEKFMPKTMAKEKDGAKSK